MAERRKYTKVFKESKDEMLTLLEDIKVNNEEFNKGACFNIGQEIAGVDFHKYRYFDLAVNELEGGRLEIVGVYPEE